jgi:hypothetical protein
VKGVLALSMVLLATAATLFVFPAFAGQNGDTLQTQDRDQDKIQDCVGCGCLLDCDCQQDQTQVQTRLHIGNR